MSYINPKYFGELRTCSQNGDEKARCIIEKFMQGGRQDELDRLISDYYAPANNQPDPLGLGNDKEAELAIRENEQPQIDEPIGLDQEPMLPLDTPSEPVNLSSALSDEMKDLIDKPELEDTTFEDFLKNKKKDGLRSRKNREYFQSFGEPERLSYLDSQKSEFEHSFDTNRRDIERQFNDMDKALGSYSQSINDLPDDGIKADLDVAGNAYDDIVDMSGKTHSFGRGWDEQDLGEVKEALLKLAQQYGRANVIAALNILKGDNATFRDHRNNAIDESVKKYGKSLDELLR